MWKFEKAGFSEFFPFWHLWCFIWKFIQMKNLKLQKFPALCLDQFDTIIMFAGNHGNSSVNNNFVDKQVGNWTTDDIVAWLKTLGLSEHSRKFQQFRINGAHLLSFDRSFLTQLGVTRIGHRQLIERSLKSLME